MRTESQVRLFTVNDPASYKCFDDHEAAIYFNLHNLVEDAIRERENPIALMEDFLGVSYSGDETVDEIANFLFNTNHMAHARSILKDNWDQMDESVPADSLLYSYGSVNHTRAVEIHLETTLRNYLESLSMIYDF